MTTELRKPRQTLKMPKWSHQTELTGLKGKLIEFDYVLPDGTTIMRGTLVGSDPFTVRVTTDDQQTRTFFKHAIGSYRSVDA